MLAGRCTPFTLHRVVLSLTPHNTVFHVFVEGKTVTNLKLTLWVQGLVSKLAVYGSSAGVGGDMPVNKDDAVRIVEAAAADEAEASALLAVASEKPGLWHGLEEQYVLAALNQANAATGTSLTVAPWTGNDTKTANEISGNVGEKLGVCVTS